MSPRAGGRRRCPTNLTGVKRVAVLVIVVAAACGLPGPAPQPPAELVFVPGADRSHAVYEVRDGTQVATLAAGGFAGNLTSGGDLGEAYLASDDGTLYRVRAGRPFHVDRAGDLRGRPPYQAALVRADRLTKFIGARTVLVVLSADGVLSGYQSGTLLWRTGVLPGSSLRAAGDAVSLGLGDAWSLVAGEDGRQVPLVSDCPDGPLAVVAGSPVFACPGASPPGASLALPTGPAFQLTAARAAGVVLAYPSGDWFRIGSGPAITGRGHGPGGEGSPALAPDGGTVYWPAQVGALALAISRDGNYLYALDAAGGLRAVTTSNHGQVARYPGIRGTSIELVTGG